MRIRFRQGAIYNGESVPITLDFPFLPSSDASFAPFASWLPGNQHFEWSKVKDSLTDPKLYLNGCAQLCANVGQFSSTDPLIEEDEDVF